MTDRNEHSGDATRAEFSEGQVRAERRVRSLGSQPSNDAFRRNLKAQFMSGAIEELDAVTREQEAWVTPGRDTTFWPLLQVAAAAAFVLLAGSWLNRGPELRFADARTASVTVGGTLYASNAAAPIPLQPGASFTVGDEGPVTLVVPGVALFEVAPGTQMTVPNVPGKWFSRRAEMRVEHGEVRFLSGGDFAGSILNVYTPEGMVEVLGTLLSVQRDDTGTCVCLLSGQALVGRDREHLESVSAGSRKVMPREGDAFISPVKPMHADGVTRFNAQHGHLIAK